MTGFARPGTVVTYRYHVTNIGRVVLDPVKVTDPMAGLSAITCPATMLGPGQAETCTATYTTTQADLDAGHITNTGTARGASPDGSQVEVHSSLTIPAAADPGFTLVKSSNLSSFGAAGTDITFTFTVSNTGNMTLHGLTITDSLPGLSSITCPASTVPPDGSITCTATYTTTAQDVANGQLTNTATAVATDPGGTTMRTTPSTVTVPVANVPTPTPAPAPRARSHRHRSP